ncbi:MAG: type II toxin-antitoxin system prevent-host-death family antitoxin [Actinomycetota bacterium]
MVPAAPEPPPADDTAGLDRVGIRQLRTSVSGLVKRAATGERIVITVDGRPMAQLGPLGRAAEPTLDDLAAAGLIEPPPAGTIDAAPDRLPAPLAMPADVGLDRLLDQIRGRR